MLSHNLRHRGIRGSEDVRGAKLAGNSPPFLGREWAVTWAAVGVDVDPERRSPRYQDTCLAPECLREL